MEQEPRNWRALATAFGWVLAAVAVVATGAWGTLAILLTGRDGDPVRGGFAAAFALAALFALIAMARQRWRATAAYAAIFVALLAWYGGLQPSNDRDWQTDVAVLPYATIEGDEVVVHNIRNFAYRTETDYTPSYYDKRFRLSELEGVDLIAVYWMGPAIAHTFLSFDIGTTRRRMCTCIGWAARWRTLGGSSSST
jgi:hypothetical protein